MDKVDRKIKEIKAEQTELDSRTSVEREVEALISQCRFKEAKKLLDSLDDKKSFRRKRRWFITGLTIPKVRKWRF